MKKEVKHNLLRDGAVVEPTAPPSHTNVVYDRKYEFDGRGKHGHYSSWCIGQAYRTRVWQLTKELQPDTILEIGPYGTPFFDWADTIDNQEWFGFQPTWLTDVTCEPIPAETNSYDLCIASEVFEHLWPHQKIVYDECMRVAKTLIVVVPYRWAPPLDNEGHDDIDEQTVRGWFGRYPDHWELISDKAYAKFGQEDSTRRWHRMIAVYHRDGRRETRWIWR